MPPSRPEGGGILRIIEERERGENAAFTSIVASAGKKRAEGNRESKRKRKEGGNRPDSLLTSYRHRERETRGGKTF